MHTALQNLKKLKALRLVENFTALFGLQIATMLLPLVTIPYLLRILGPENYGRVALAQALTQYFVLIADYGFSLSATRQVSACRDDPVALGELIGAVTTVKACLLIMGLVPLIALVATVPLFESDWALYFGAYLAVLGSVVFPLPLLQGLERMRLIAASMITAQIAVLGAILMWVGQPGDFALAAALQGAAPILAGVIAISCLRLEGPLQIARPTWNRVRSVLADGWHIFFSTAATSAYSNTNILVLGFLTDPAVVGQFSAAEKLFRAVQSLLLPLTQSVYPHVARLCSQSQQAALVFLRQFFRFKILLTVLMSVALLIAGPSLIDMLFGSAFTPSKRILQWMTPLLVIVGISHVLGVQIMLNFGMEKSFSRILVFSGLLNLCLLALLVPWFGGEGAAISLLATECVVTGAMAFTLARASLMAPLLWRRTS